MEKPILTQFNNIAPLFIQEYERYLPTAFDDSLTMLQKVNKIIKNMQEVGAFTEAVIAKWNELIQWLMEQGLFDTGISDARFYGAKGDGVTDDTEALKEWIASTRKNLVLREGTYILKGSLDSYVEGRTIKTEGATIKYDGLADGKVFNIYGSKSDIHVRIDGNNKASHGVIIKEGADDCIVSDCFIANLKSIASNCIGISSYARGGVLIEDNHIENVNALSNNLLGDAIGASRGIFINNTLPAVEWNIIKNNFIDGVLGEEGDGIQVLFYNGTYTPYITSKCLIQDNTVKDANRRGIKVQGSDVKVIGNIILNTLTPEETPNAVTAINVIYSDNVTVSDNDIDASVMAGIMVTGGAASGTPFYMRNCTVKNNRIKASYVFTAIYLDYCLDSDIKSNTIYDGEKAIAMSNCSNLNISDNTLFGGNDELSQVAINIVANNNNIAVRGNMGLSGKRLYFISNNAPNCIIEDNHSKVLGGHIRSYETAVGTIYRNNTNSGDGTTYIGEYIDQFVIGGRNTGPGATNYPDIMWSDVIPSPTTFPTKHFNVGDICFNKLAGAGGKIGWVNIQSGTPGTWKPFGVIDL